LTIKSSSTKNEKAFLSALLGNYTWNAWPFHKHNKLLFLYLEALFMTLKHTAGTAAAL
jgi:hypothetical protein